MLAVFSASVATRRRQRLAWVKALRVALPVMAAATLAGVTGQVVWRGIRMVLIPEAEAPAAAVRMVNPIFTGESRDGSRYFVSAKSGMRDAGDETRIVLDAPNISVSRLDGEPTNTTARRGVFRQDDMTLRLQGDVRVQDGSGYRLNFNDAVFDIRTGRVTGSGVQSQGRGAEVSSDRYTVDQDGGRMVFKGRVRGRIGAQ